MKILISGSNGFIGQHLVRYAKDQGHAVYRLVRGKGGADTMSWNPALGLIDSTQLEGFDVIIHLAGKNIAEKRWTTRTKEEILKSRVTSATLLSSTLLKLKSPPAVFLSASAVGFYGDRGEEIITEDAPPGNDFLSQVCVSWEKAAQLSPQLSTRVIHLRFGMVLSKEGGALKKMLIPFRFGLGGRLGNGKQYVSWITITDLLRAIFHCIKEPSIFGPVNITSPNAITNDEFTNTLGQMLRRPTIFSLPAPILRVIFGEMADVLFLSSIRAIPSKLQSTRFHFEHESIRMALQAVLP